MLQLLSYAERVSAQEETAVQQHSKQTAQLANTCPGVLRHPEAQQQPTTVVRTSQRTCLQGPAVLADNHCIWALSS